MEIPASRTESVEAMGEARYRKYLDALGKVVTEAKRRFLAELPEVAMRGLHRKWGFSSLHEFAAKKAGCSKQVVDDVLRIHAKIGRYERLWKPLREGVIGWSKLKVIAPFVTPETVGWWARKVKTCSKQLLEDECARLRAEAKAREAAARTSGGSPGPKPDAEGPDRAGDSGGAAGDSAPGHGGEPHQKGLFDSGGHESEDDSAPDSSSRRLSVEFDSETMALLEALRLQAEKAQGRAVSLGEVVRESVRERALGASAGAAGPDVETDPGGGISQGSANEGGETRAKRPRGRRSRRGAPIPALLVLYRNVESDELHIPTREGVKPVDPSDYAEVCETAEVVEFDALKDAVRARPGRRGSRYTRVQHQLMVAARSGNRCSFPGCRAPAVEWHHVRPIGEDGTSDAGNQAPVCATHHEAPHSGWVEGHRGPAEGWEYVRPGGEARGRGADLAWQARRAMSGGGG